MRAALETQLNIPQRPPGGPEGAPMDVHLCFHC
jgi:hypothetical protein